MYKEISPFVFSGLPGSQITTFLNFVFSPYIMVFAHNEWIS
jgi:hypothetical protein